MVTVTKWKVILLAMVIAGCCVIPVAVQATDVNKTLSPYFLIENGDPQVDQFPLKKTNVNVSISGVIADVVVTQRYANGGPNPINARYIFPASTRAAVHGMTMQIGERRIRAKIEERQAAQRQFDQAKKQGKSASLLKQQRPNVFSMNVANIMPGDHIDIELRYTELLVPTDGTYQFVYPTVVGPRYLSHPESTAQETDRWVKNPYLVEGDPPRGTFTIQVTISAGIKLQEAICNTHATNISWENESMARIGLAPGERHGGNRDFIVDYRLAGRKIESGLMLYTGKDEKFFLLIAQPPERVQPADIPVREYIIVVDISGSMHGFPLNTAKKLLENLIGSLREKDRFNVILFAGGSKVMAPTSLPATQANIQGALQLIDQQRGGGGTDLYSALKKSLALPRDKNVSRSVLIITDGYISAEKDVFGLIQENLNRTNVFSFGIGSSVNRYLIEGIAKAGMGEPFIVTRSEEAFATAERFRRYVASPVLTDIVVKPDGFEIYDVEPVSIPDLFAHRPVIVFGKWRGEPRGHIELSGTGGKGRYVRSFNVAETRPLEMNAALKYLWARHRIARLSDYNVSAADADNKARITSLGLTYNLLTAHTSFIVVHEVVRNPSGVGKDVTQPLPLPEGVSSLAVGGCARVPEPELSLMFLVIAVFIASVSLYRRCTGGGKGVNLL